MGYYTQFSLEICPMPSNETYLKIMRSITAKIYGFNYDEITDSIASECFYNSIKWYDHDTDMIEISKEFSEFTFILYGEGEENRDIWRSYYRNGEYEHLQAEIIFPKPSKEWC